jgi:hypothetical protein
MRTRFGQPKIYDSGTEQLVFRGLGVRVQADNENFVVARETLNQSE